MAPRVLPIVAVTLALVTAATTGSAETTQLGGPGQTIRGLQVYDEVEIIGELKVQPYDGNAGGWLHIKSNRITIDVNGVIDASGSGYQGSKEAATETNQGPGFGNSAMPMDPNVAVPGGGGSHISNAGNGLEVTQCQPVAGSEGGMAHSATFDPLNLMASPLGFGSAGGFGRAGSMNPGYIDPGGSGGGLIVLEAHTVQIFGMLQANGNSANSPLSIATGAGGGAGGTIVIVANAFEVGANTAMQAAGGDGEFGSSAGGGGSGGLIVLQVGSNFDLTPIEARIFYNGGGSKATVCSAGLNGGNGRLDRLDPPSCIDADGDGASSAQCGGTDCNDGDAAIGPTAIEVCDNVDNNCDGEVDEASSEDLCNAGSGEVCSDGSCVDPDTGSGGGGGQAVVELPAQIQLRGGICASLAPGDPRDAGGPAGKSFLAALASLLAAALLRRRS